MMFTTKTIRMHVDDVKMSEATELEMQETESTLGKEMQKRLDFWFNANLTPVEPPKLLMIGTPHRAHSWAMEAMMHRIRMETILIPLNIRSPKDK